jgi:hypothetical protein
MGDTVIDTSNPLASAPDALGFEVVHALTAPDAREDHVLFRLAIVRDDDADRLAHCLGRRVPEYPLGGSIPGRDDAVHVLADDRVV